MPRGYIKHKERTLQERKEYFKPIGIIGDEIYVLEYLSIVKDNSNKVIGGSAVGYVVELIDWDKYSEYEAVDYPNAIEVDAYIRKIGFKREDYPLLSIIQSGDIFDDLLNQDESLHGTFDRVYEPDLLLDIEEILAIESRRSYRR